MKHENVLRFGVALAVACFCVAAHLAHGLVFALPILSACILIWVIAEAAIKDIRR